MSASVRDQLLVRIGILEVAFVNAVQLLDVTQRERLVQALLNETPVLGREFTSHEALAFENRICAWIRDGSDPLNLWEPL